MVQGHRPRPEGPEAAAGRRSRRPRPRRAPGRRRRRPSARPRPQRPARRRRAGVPDRAAAALLLRRQADRRRRSRPAHPSRDDGPPGCGPGIRRRPRRAGASHGRRSRPGALARRPEHGRAARRGQRDLPAVRPAAAFIRARDQRCSFPGCGHRAETCEIDHVRNFGSGPRDGKTVRRNLESNAEQSSPAVSGRWCRRSARAGCRRGRRAARSRAPCGSAPTGCSGACRRSAAARECPGRRSP